MYKIKKIKGTVVLKKVKVGVVTLGVLAAFFVMMSIQPKGVAYSYYSTVQGMLTEMNYINTEINNISSDISQLNNMIQDVNQQLVTLENERRQLEIEVQFLEQE